MNMIKIPCCSKYTGLLIEQLDIRNAKQDDWALKWPLWCFDALVLDRHQCQIFFFSLCQYVSKHPPGMEKEHYLHSLPTVSVFWHLFPSTTHSQMSSSDRNSWWTYKNMNIFVSALKRMESLGSPKVSTAPIVLLALTNTGLCGKLHAWCRVTVHYV